MPANVGILSRGAQSEPDSLADQQAKARRFSQTAQVGEDMLLQEKQRLQGAAQKAAHALELAGRGGTDEWNRLKEIERTGVDPSVKKRSVFDRTIGPLGALDKLHGLAAFSIADQPWAAALGAIVGGIGGALAAGPVGAYGGATLGATLGGAIAPGGGGTEERAGEKEIVLGDYVNILRGNREELLDKFGEDFLGEDGRMGGAQLRKNLFPDSAFGEIGTRKDAGILEKIGAGTFDFLVGEVAIDPLSAFIGGGGAMGRKLLFARGSALTNKMVTGLTKRYGTRLKNIPKDALEELPVMERKFVEHYVKKEAAVEAQMIKELPENFRGFIRDEDLIGAAMPAAITEFSVQYLAPLVRKDFGKLPSWFINYAAKNGYNDILGGVRLTAHPFTARGTTPLIGTRGLGRKITEPVRKRLSGRLEGSPFFNKVDDFINGLDTRNKVLRGIGAGEEGPLLAFWAKEQGNFGRLAQDMAGATDSAFHSLNSLIDDMKRLSGKDFDAAMDDLVELKQNGRVIEMSEATAVKAQHARSKVAQGSKLSTDEKLAVKASEFVSKWHQLDQTFREVAQGVGLDFGNIDGHVALMVSPEGRKVADVLLKNLPDQLDPRLFNLEDVPENARQGVQLLQQILHPLAVEKGAPIQSVAMSRFMRERTFGKTIPMHQLDDAENAPLGLLHFFDPEQGVFMSHSEMNRRVGDALVWLKDEGVIQASPLRGTPIEELRFFETDPGRIMADYSISMMKAITEKALVNEWRKVGLIKSQDFKYNSHQMAFEMNQHLTSMTGAAFREEIASRFEQAFTDMPQYLDKMVRGGPVEEVAVGRFGKVKVPTGTKRDPIWKEMHGRIRRNLAHQEKYAGRMKQERIKVRNRLRAQGVPIEEATEFSENLALGELDEFLDVTLLSHERELYDNITIAREAALRRAEASADYDSLARELQDIEDAHRQAKNRMRGWRRETRQRISQQERTEHISEMQFRTPESQQHLARTVAAPVRRAVSDLEALAGTQGHNQLSEPLSRLSRALEDGLWGDARSALDEATALLDELGGTEDVLHSAQAILIDALRQEQRAGRIAHQQVDLWEAMTPQDFLGDKGRRQLIETLDSEAMEMARQRVAHLMRGRSQGKEMYARRLQDAQKKLDMIEKMHAGRRIWRGGPDAQSTIEDLLADAGLLDDMILDYSGGTKYGLGFVLISKESFPQAPYRQVKDELGTGGAALQSMIPSVGKAADPTPWETPLMRALGNVTSDEMAVIMNPNALQDDRFLLEVLGPTQAEGRLAGFGVSEENIDEMVDLARQEIYERTQASLVQRGLPEEFIVVRGQERPWQVGDFGDAVPLTFRYTQAEQFGARRYVFRVRREDVLIDSNALTPVGPENMRRVAWPENDEIRVMADKMMPVPPAELDIAEVADVVRNLPWEQAREFGISKEVYNTLSYFPKRLVKEFEELKSTLASLQARRVNQSNLVKGAKRTADDLDETASLLRRLESAINRNRWDEAESILRDPQRMRVFKRVLPTNEHGRLLAMRELVDKHRALSSLKAGPERRALEDSIDSVNKLREVMMYDKQNALESLEELGFDLSEMAARTQSAEMSEWLDDAARYMNIMEDMIGVVRNNDGTLSYRMLYDPNDSQYAHWVDEASKIANKLGWHQDPVRLAKNKSLVPTAERAGFLPPAAGGVGGAALSGESMNAYALDLMKQITRNTMALATEEGLESFVKSIRAVTAWWKTMATVSRVSFHVRNLIGGMWNNQIADVRASDYAYTARWLPEWFKLNNSMSAPDAIKALKAKNAKAGEIFEQMWNEGVLHTSFADAEIHEIMRQAVRAGPIQRWNPASRFGPLARAGASGMKGVEGFLRMSAFVRHYELGGGSVSARQAAEWVRTIHFDYSDVTKLEDTVRRFVPFFIWTRRNIPLQLRTLIERPSIMARYMHLQNAVDDNFNSGAYDHLPPNRWDTGMAVGTDYVMNGNTPFYARFIFDPDLPIKDLFELENPISPTAWARLVANNIGPQFSSIFTLLDEGNPRQQNAPAGLSHIIQGLGQLGLDKTPFGENHAVPTTSAVTAEFFRTFMPPAGEYLTPTISTDPRSKQRFGALEDENINPTTGLGIQFMRGLGGRFESPETLRPSVMSSQFSYNSLKSHLRRTGQITPEMEEMIDALLNE